eukprot:TRINITY_DN7195_c0_g1_i2.p1 TRINITY_DN7195_c0_g1~~TRINITY_DN7195_c0_g1_i2.p1  ORF type:complete len:187 (-),score=37.94 TRINITY_DN7195_c0_g1_i2:54-614(-)
MDSRNMPHHGKVTQNNVWLHDANLPAETLFYFHFLPLPWIMVQSDRIFHSFLTVLSPHESLRFTVFNVSFGILPIFVLLANVLTQYVCVHGVHQYSSIASALSVSVLLTIRKFVSLLASVMLFKNVFSIMHWAGSALVLGGAMAYSLSSSKAKRSKKSRETEDVDHTIARTASEAMITHQRREHQD